jgi:DNA-binding MarR family transcriptional regulator
MTAQASIDKVRAFNRFYTRVLGLLDRHFLESQYSLTEVRVLYEIAHGELCTAKAIRAEMGIDAGYLSRLLDAFIRGRLVKRTPVREDKRYHVLNLTQKGRDVFARLNASQHRSLEALVSRLSAADCRDLVGHMERIQELIGGV